MQEDVVGLLEDRLSDGVDEEGAQGPVVGAEDRQGGGSEGAGDLLAGDPAGQRPVGEGERLGGLGGDLVEPALLRRQQQAGPVTEAVIERPVRRTRT